MQVHLRPYGTSAAINFSLYDSNGQNIVTSTSFQSGDILVRADGGTETSAAYLPSDVGTGYELILSESELSCKRLYGSIVDTTPSKEWLDTSFLVETYGTSAAQHPNMGNFSPTIDGITLDELFLDMMALTHGKINKSDNVYTYYRADGSTVAFILSAGISGRIRLA